MYFQGEFYNSVAHAYMAAKTEDPVLKRRILKAPTYKEMQQVAQLVSEPLDWKQRRLQIMLILTRDKFRRNREIRERLLQTGSKLLKNTLLIRSSAEATEEKLYWGVYSQGKAILGENKLGELLEQVRATIASETEITYWINS